MQLLSQENAYKYCLKYLKTLGYKWHYITKINNNRYAIVLGNMNNESYNILIVFKRDVFYSSKQICNIEGASETVNVEELKTAKLMDISFIYWVYENGNIYNCEIDKFLKDSVKWHNKEGKDVRSVGMKELERVNVK